MNNAIATSWSQIDLENQIVLGSNRKYASSQGQMLALNIAECWLFQAYDVAGRVIANNLPNRPCKVSQT